MSNLSVCSLVLVRPRREAPYSRLPCSRWIASRLPYSRLPCFRSSASQLPYSQLPCFRSSASQLPYSRLPCFRSTVSQLPCSQPPCFRRPRCSHLIRRGLVRGSLVRRSCALRRYHTMTAELPWLGCRSDCWPPVVHRRQKCVVGAGSVHMLGLQFGWPPVLLVGCLFFRRGRARRDSTSSAVIADMVERGAVDDGLAVNVMNVRDIHIASPSGCNRKLRHSNIHPDSRDHHSRSRSRRRRKSRHCVPQ